MRSTPQVPVLRKDLMYKNNETGDQVELAADIVQFMHEWSTNVAGQVTTDTLHNMAMGELPR